MFFLTMCMAVLFLPWQVLIVPVNTFKMFDVAEVTTFSKRQVGHISGLRETFQPD